MDIKLPSYKELADLLIELTEKNVANLECNEWDWFFIKTLSHQIIPEYWMKAIRYRKILKDNAKKE